MKKVIAFAAGTVAVLATAIGVQVFATSGHDDAKSPPAVSTTDTPVPSDGSATTPPDASPSGSAEGATKEDDGDREGFTEDHSGKPGEDK